LIGHLIALEEPQVQTFKLCEEIHCESATEFLETIAPFGPVFRRFSAAEAWIFRGQPSADFKLEPSAYREDGRKILIALSRSGLNGNDPDHTFLRQAYIEAEAIQRFFHRCDHAGLPFPEDSQVTRSQLNAYVECLRNVVRGPTDKAAEFALQQLMCRPEDSWIPRTLLSFVAIAQHHAIPTRLLDWSHSAFIAAYFAARGSIELKSPRFSVYAMFASELSIGTKIRSATQECDVSIKMVSVPRAANANLHAQEGVFTYLRLNSVEPLYRPFQHSPLDDLLADLENPEPQYGPLLFKITLGQDHAAEVLWFLDKMGHDAARLFPGFSGAAKAVFDFAKMKPVNSGTATQD
jgi:hypothetical protein